MGYAWVLRKCWRVVTLGLDCFRVMGAVKAAEAKEWREKNAAVSANNVTMVFR